MVRSRQATALAVLGLLSAAIFAMTPAAQNHTRAFTTYGAATVRERLQRNVTLPVSFIENAGQTDARVRFYAQGAGYAFYLTPREAVFEFAAPSNRTSMLTPVAHRIQTMGTILRLRFVNGIPKVIVAGEERAAGEINYFQGNDPSHCAGWKPL